MNDLIPYLIYGVFAVGAAAVYVGLPRPDRTAGKAALLIGLAAVALWIVVAASYADPPYGGYTYLFSAIALLSAGRVVTHPKPVYSVLYFVLTVIAVAFLLVLQMAEFLAVALIIVYAGAILVVYAFVIMLAQQTGGAAHDLRAREPLLAVLAGFVTMAAVAGQVTRLPGGATRPADAPVRLAADERADERAANFSSRGPQQQSPNPKGADQRADERAANFSSRGPQQQSPNHKGSLVASAASPAPAEEAEAKVIEAEEPVPPAPLSNTERIGTSLFTTYMVALQTAGVLLLIAMVGGVAISRKRIPAEEVSQPEKPLGQIGREVPPF